MNDIPELVKDIYQVFIDYYGENKVDLQVYNNDNIIKLEDSHDTRAGDYIILTHWDTVTVSNEYDESIDIWDLYSATLLSPSGELRMHPLFNRSTYDDIQWNSNYCHSHVRSLIKNRCEEFRTSCLGVGPIRETISKLRGTYFKDLDVWRLYCWELDKYVHVESLNGGPYRRLNEVGKNTSASLDGFKVNFTFDYPASRICKIFTKHLIKLLFKDNILRYNYVDGRYTIAMTYIDAVMSISNAFIEWYNSSPNIYKEHNVKSLFEHSFLEKAFIKEGVLIKNLDNDTNNVAMDVGRVLFNFKGKPVTLQNTVLKGDYTVGEVIIVNTSILNYVIYVILRYLNLHYGESTDTTSQKTRIL